MSESQAAIQRDPDKVEKWDDRTLTQFKKEPGAGEVPIFFSWNADRQKRTWRF